MLERIKQVLLNYSTPQHYYLQSSIKKFLKKCGLISILIDIGCGNSPFTKLFNYKNLILVDIDKRGIVDLLSDVCALAIKGNCADLVLLTEVLEHVKDENKALCEIHRILKPGGWFIISVPFLFGIHETSDYKRWTAQGLKLLLEEKGFKIVDFVYRGGIFSALLALWRNFPKDLAGGNFQSTSAKIFYPLIAFHFSSCLILTPIIIILDKLDKKKLSSTGYIVLCRKE